ncbi:hypothetical protein QBZ16_003551 [Prototheca wickerhamii]|uniref:Fungal lipase-type domain-containing protein n=1 Tax=Prototheca wickerhamii TaxID=3111 RepID=A0AAD9IHR3_PROWI|nr:hypothetical protein QBZ16_003551 [Prototheca wickerhamii]
MIAGQYWCKHLLWCLRKAYVGQSVLLASASFEAYFGLAKEVSLPDETVTGARTTYVDRDFVRDQYQGLVEVRLLSVTGLEDSAQSWLGRQVYGSLQLGVRQLAKAAVESETSWTENLRALAARADFSAAWGQGSKDGDEAPEPEDEMPFRAATQRRLIYLRSRDSVPALHIAIKRGGFGLDPELLATGQLEIGNLMDGQQHCIELALERPKEDDEEALVEETEGGAAKGAGSKQKRKKRKKRRSEAGAGAGPSLEETAPPLSDPPSPPPAATVSLRFIPFKEILEHRSEATLSALFGQPSESFETNPWKALLDTASGPTAEQAPLRPLCFIDQPDTDTQVWVFANLERRILCFAFRGTEQDSWRDMLTDISMAPAPVEPDKIPTLPSHRGLGATPPSSSLLRDLKRQLKAARSQLEKLTDAAEPAKAEAEAEARPWVHQGFLTAYDSVRSALMEVAEMCVGGREPKSRASAGRGARSWRILVTGHSLGGALATLGAYDLALHRWPAHTAPPRLTMYNYGSPRYNRLVPDSWRVVNNKDAVSSIPRLMGYCHVGHAVRLLGRGRVEVQRDSSLAQGEGVAMPDLLPALAGMLAVSAPELKARALALTAAAAQRLWEDEVAAWRALLNRDAISEHFEEYYLEALKLCLAEHLKHDKGGKE